MSIPSAVKRLRQSTVTAASVFWFGRVLDLRVGLNIVFTWHMAVSVGASSVVFSLDISNLGTELGDPLDDRTACRRRVLGTRGWRDCCLLARRGDQECISGENGLWQPKLS